MAGRSPSLRRIQADIRELSRDPSDQYVAHPLEDDMFEWHFTIRGAEGTEFEGGVYHGRILLPPEYPFKPPNIVFLTPSGRFEVGTKICLSFSAYHPELWQPAWGVRLILEALISFLPTPGDGAIGALDWTKVERKRLAKKSLSFSCPKCGNCLALLPPLRPKKAGEDGKADKANPFQKELEKLHALQGLHHAKEEEDDAREDDKKKESEPTECVPCGSDEGGNQSGAEGTETAAEESGGAEANNLSSGEAEAEESDAGNITPAGLNAAGGIEASTLGKEDTPLEARSAPLAAPAADASPQHSQDESREGSAIANPTEADRVRKPLVSARDDPVVHGVILFFALSIFAFARLCRNVMSDLSRLGI